MVGSGPGLHEISSRLVSHGKSLISSRLVFARRPFQNISSRLAFAFARRGKKSEITKNETRRDETKFDVDIWRAPRKFSFAVLTYLFTFLRVFRLFFTFLVLFYYMLLFFICSFMLLVYSLFSDCFLCNV